MTSMVSTLTYWSSVDVAFIEMNMQVDWKVRREVSRNVSHIVSGRVDVQTDVTEEALRGIVRR